MVKSVNYTPTGSTTVWGACKQRISKLKALLESDIGRGARADVLFWPQVVAPSRGKCLTSLGSASGKHQPCIVGEPALQQNIALQAGPELAVVLCFAVASSSKAAVGDSGHAWSLWQAAAALARTATRA